MTTDTVPSGVHLPAREAEILACAAKGLTDKQIATELGISRDTVGTYWRRILLRYNASSRTEVVARAAEAEGAKRLGSAENEVTRLHQEIKERTEAQAREVAHRNLLTAIQDALLVYVSGERDPKQVLKAVLADLVGLTQSRYGFVAELHEFDGGSELRLLTSTGIDRLPDTAHAVLQSNRPYLCHEPGGRASFLGVPVLFGATVVGVIGIGDRPGGYDGDLARYVEPLAATCGTIIGSARAEDARKRAEEANAETVARLETLLNSLESGVMFVDETRKVRYVNRLFCKHFTPGFSPEEIMGMSTHTLLEEFKGELRDPDAFLAWIEEVISEGSAKRRETVHAADGRVFVCNFDTVQVGDKGAGHVWRYTQVLSARTT